MIKSILTTLLIVLAIITTQAQTISNISPNSAAPGDYLQVTITGTNTNFLQGSTTCWLDESFSQGSPMYIYGSPTTVISPTSLIADLYIPTDANGSFDVNVYESGGLITTFSGFTVNGPQIVSISPNVANAGDNLVVTITGQNTSFLQGSTSCGIEIYDQGSPVMVMGNPTTVINGTSLTADLTIPSSTSGGYYDVIVYDAPGTIYYTSFQVVGPELVSSSPDSVDVNDILTVSIVGTNTSFTQGSQTVRYYGQSSTTITATNVVASDDFNITADLLIPNNADIGDYWMTLDQAGQSTLYLSDALHVRDYREITDVIPNNGLQSQSLTVGITGVGTNFVQGSFTTNVTLNYNGFTQGSPTVMYMSGITVTSSTDLYGTLDISSSAVPGFWDMTVDPGFTNPILAETAFAVNQDLGGTGSASGTINDGTGKSAVVAAWGALVYLIDSNGDTLQYDVCDQNGEYSFENLPDGTYFIHVFGEDNSSPPSFTIVSGANLVYLDYTMTGNGLVQKVINPQLQRNKNLTVYPVPTRSILNLQLDKSIGVFTVQIIDVQGKIVLMRRIISNKAQLDVNGITPGSYLLQMSNEQHFETKEIVIE